MKMRGKGITVLALAGLLAAGLLWAAPRYSSASTQGYSPDSQHLVKIADVSRDFKKRIERIIFASAFMEVSHREALARMSDWIDENQYPRLGEFLDALTQEDAEILFAAFEEDQKITSSEVMPVIEAADRISQHTALSFPFTGEFFVAQGNTGWVSHKKGTSNEFAWDFVIQKDGGMIFGNGGKNENYYAWGKPVLAPAAGTVKQIRNDQEDHPPLTTELNKSNYVVIDHGFGEISNIHHLMKGSIIVEPGDRVVRGQVLGKVGDSGISMFPLIHYELDRGEWDKRKPASSVFACYFARHKTEDNHRLVISGTPKDGEYILGVDDYLDYYYGVTPAK